MGDGAVRCGDHRRRPCDADLVPGERVGSTPITPMLGKIPGWAPEIGLREGLRRLVDETRATLAPDGRVAKT